MNTTYTVLIADDNEIDRLAVTQLVRKYPFLKIAGTYSSALAALQAAEELQPDIAFLDIDMPELSGFDLRRRLDSLKACIFITSYPDYALESFEMAAFDFMVKPVNKERFDTCINRLQQYLDILEKSALFDFNMGGDTIYIKEGYEQVKLNMRDIIYLEALKDYTSVVTRQKKYCVHALLGNLLKDDSFKNFVRIHRSYAVQKNYVEKVNAQEIYAGDVPLPLGRMYKDSVNEILGG